MPTSVKPDNSEAAATDTLRFASGSDSISVLGEFSPLRRDSIYHFEVARPGRLEARLFTAGPNVNLRFNQLLMPGGEADGPFGQQVTYTLQKKGWYALRIGPDRMAEGDTPGRFRLTIRIR
ncbi:hypothetical protein [Flaviaesturariibacter terrae]